MDEIKIINFADCIIETSLKAKSVTKIDMVNPIPPKHDAPMICDHFTPLGK